MPACSSISPVIGCMRLPKPELISAPRTGSRSRNSSPAMPLRLKNSGRPVSSGVNRYQLPEASLPLKAAKTRSPVSRKLPRSSATTSITASNRSPLRPPLARAGSSGKRPANWSACWRVPPAAMMASANVVSMRPATRWSTVVVRAERRFAWNWPSARREATRVVFGLSLALTPARRSAPSSPVSNQADSAVPGRRRWPRVGEASRRATAAAVASSGLAPSTSSTSMVETLAVTVPSRVTVAASPASARRSFICSRLSGFRVSGSARTSRNSASMIRITAAPPMRSAVRDVTSRRRTATGIRGGFRVRFMPFLPSRGREGPRSGSHKARKGPESPQRRDSCAASLAMG